MAFEHQGLQIGPPRIKGGSMPGAARAHDYNISNVFHRLFRLRNLNSVSPATYGRLAMPCLFRPGAVVDAPNRRIRLNSSGTNAPALTRVRSPARTDDAEANKGSYAL